MDGSRFAAVMEQHSDEDLRAIASSNEDEYRAEAILAAKREIGRRGLPPVEEVEAAEIVARVEATTSAKARQPLGLAFLLLAIAAPVPSLLVAAWFDSQGYKRKSSTMARWALFAIAGYVCIVGLIALMEMATRAPK